jgi:DNA helicase-2/ATP-dependent DNA helicase PcrA
VKAAPGTAFVHQLSDLAEDATDLSDERREHVDALARLGHEYVTAEGGAGSLDGFLAYLNTALRGEDGPETGESIELLTFHRAKGLEFDTVWVTGLEQGLVPISFADTPSQRAEERRLLYVACSRAERALHLSWAQERTIGVRVARRRPSPWVAVIHQAIADDPVANRPPVDPRAELAKARAQLRATSRADPAVVAALTDWRGNVARAHDITPSVICTDATLDELARARPSTRSALLAVPGIGPAEAERYGASILEVLAGLTTPAR